MAACVNCGNPLPEAAKFCGQCGATVRAPEPVAAPTPAPAPALGAMTMVGVPSPMPATPPATTAEPAAPKPGIGSKTMLGFSAPMIPPAAAPAAPAPAPAPIAPGDVRVRPGATMLGVALPGIAPLHASEPAPVAPKPNLNQRTMLGIAVPGVAPTHEPAPRQPAHRTMLGVAAPGIAPTYPIAQPPRPMEPAPAIVPAPAPFVDEAVPEGPAIPQKKGLPLALVAGGAGAALLVVGVVIALVVRGAPPLVASAKLSAEGKEQVHLVCEGCTDGTTAALGTAKATFAQHQADLDVTDPLVVGDNPFTITLDRPGMGRDESVKVTVPVAYRIRADLGQINAAAPAILVHVGATPGDTVTLDGKPVALDPAGQAVVTLDLTSDVTGEGDARTIERKLPYKVSGPKGEIGSGELDAKVAVAPLHLDAPGPRATIEGTALNVAGRTSKGAQVTINGAAAAVNDDGSFGVRAPAPADGDELLVRAQAKGVATRVVHVPIKKVSSLSAEAAALEKSSALGFDALSADLAASTGKPVAVAGRVLEARTQNHGTVMVVDDARGCSKKPCVVRVLYGGETPIAAGDDVRAYGAVKGGFASKDGAQVPEVTADFLLKGAK